LKCINCNVTLPDDATECYLCGAKVTTDVIRCPKCFIKLEKSIKTCPKCGYNMEERLKKEEEIPNKKLTKKQLVFFVVLPLICIALIFSVYGICYSQKQAAFKTEAEDYVASLDENLEIMTELAEGYNEVYNGEWLTYAENTLEFEKGHTKEINDLVDKRDTFTYLATELSQKAPNDEASKLMRTVFENYDNCHIYVVGKQGKFPGYMEGYEKLLEEYRKSVEKLNKRIK